MSLHASCTELCRPGMLFISAIVGISLPFVSGLQDTDITAHKPHQSCMRMIRDAVETCTICPV